MLSTVGLELTSVINSDLTWKKVSKGNRRTSRRARKSVAISLRTSGDSINKNLKRVDMSVSESEKLGVTVLGCRFSEKEGHVPIKKRRFLFRSPSPPPRTPSPCPQETERLVNSQHNSVQELHSDLITKCQLVAASANDLGQIVDTELHVDVKKSGKISEQLDDNEDFSGISILAAAACCSSLGGGAGYAEVGSGVEESFAPERPPELLLNNESCSLSKGLSKEDLVGSAEISTEGTGSCISTVPIEELTNSLRADKSSPKGLVHGTDMVGTYLLDNSGAVSRDPSKDDGTVKTDGFSLRDDRSHWDLNTVMDAWECPFDFQYADAQTNVADGVSEHVEDGMCGDEMRSSEGNDLQKEPGGTKCNIEKTLLPCVTRGLAHETQELNVLEQKLDACSNIEGAICLPEKLLSAGINTNPNMDLVKETKLLHHQEKVIPKIGSVLSIPVEHAVGPSTSANGDENASVLCATLGSRGSSGGLSSHQVASLDSYLDHSISPECSHLTSACRSEGNCNAASIGATSVKNIDDGAANTQVGENSSSSCQFEKQKVALGVTCVKSIDDCAADRQVGETNISGCQFEKQKVDLAVEAFPEKAGCEIGNGLNENDDAEGISGLHDDQNISKNVVDIETSQPGPLHHVIEDVVCKSDDMGFPQSLGAFVGGQISVALDTNVQQDKVSVHDTAETDTRVHIDAEEPTTKSSEKPMALLGYPCDFSSHDDAHRSYSGYLVNSSDNVAPQEPFEDSNDSAVDPGLVGMEKTSELQVDYDSQYEDGELRESIEHTWEEYDGEDGEAEHVDYGSDNRDTYSFDTRDHYVSMSVQVEGAECKNQRFANTNNTGSEAELLMTKETNSQSCLGGLTMTKVIVAGSGEERAVRTSRLCGRPPVSGEDAINESDLNVKFVKEPDVGSDKVVRDNESHARGEDTKYLGQSGDLKIKMSGWDRLPESHKSSSDKAAGVGDGSGRTSSFGDCMDGLDAEDTETRVVGSRTFKRELQSRIEGPENGYVFPRKDRLLGSRSNDVDDSNPRSEREFGFVTSSGRGRYSHFNARGRGGDHFVDYPEDHRRGLKRAHSPHYRGLTDTPCPGMENSATAVSGNVENNGIIFASDVTNVKAGAAGPSDHAGRQTTYPSPHGVHRPFRRSGSPVDRGEAFGMRVGIRAAGEMNSDRSLTVGRGRYFRYGPRVDGRGPRGRYHGPVSDGFIESSSNYSHHLARRERSFSPTERRGDPRVRRSRTKSSSRSRTRSPRGRNGTGVAGDPCFRQRSRSPNFRSEGRMLRMRSPYQRPGFSAADHMVGFMSMPRRRDSPLHNSRWIDDRKDGVIHFREQGYKQRSLGFDRRSPGRILTRSDRFDFVDSSQKLKPNEYYRSMRPRRFSEMDGVGRGGPRHEGSDDDRRKHGYGYGLVRPLRRYDTDGAVKRFHYDIENGFAVAPNSQNKDSTEFHDRGSPKDYSRDMASHNGDVPRRSREERGPFVYRRDGKFNGNSKSFGMRECDEDVAPKRRRPL
ncbi:hypothetical protein L1049_005867 [Liquidambar formosana]|uniref:Uncharacterized protein n=1 Tax=Liquidambar formosana TaxID=63359 RepID=A0AAP0RG34_LIQFO